MIFSKFLNLIEANKCTKYQLEHVRDLGEYCRGDDFCNIVKNDFVGECKACTATVNCTDNMKSQESVNSCIFRCYGKFVIISFIFRNCVDQI